MNETESSELLTLSELAKRLPCVRGGKPPNRSTLYRWATAGLRSRSGYQIRMETKLVGGTICASRDDVDRFCDALDDIKWNPPVYLNRREEKRMRREADKAFALAMKL